MRSYCLSTQGESKVTLKLHWETLMSSKQASRARNIYFFFYCVFVSHTKVLTEGTCSMAEDTVELFKKSVP